MPELKSTRRMYTPLSSVYSANILASKLAKMMVVWTVLKKLASNLTNLLVREPRRDCFLRFSKDIKLPLIVLDLAFGTSLSY